MRIIEPFDWKFMLNAESSKMASCVCERLGTGGISTWLNLCFYVGNVCRDRWEILACKFWTSHSQVHLPRQFALHIRLLRHASARFAITWPMFIFEFYSRLQQSLPLWPHTNALQISLEYSISAEGFLSKNSFLRRETAALAVNPINIWDPMFRKLILFTSRTLPQGQTRAKGCLDPVNLVIWGVMLLKLVMLTRFILNDFPSRILYRL